MHPVPLIGNGDIYTHLDAERARESGVQTLMVLPSTALAALSPSLSGPQGPFHASHASHVQYGTDGTDGT